MNLMLPFASKALPDGKRLFRRKHGKTVTLATNGNTVVEFVVPYAQAKINTCELVWFPEGVVVDFQVFDTAAGSYSGTPNAMLDQFGFDVPIAKDWSLDKSEYEADLFMGMIIRATFKNNTAVTKTVGMSVVFHEVKT